MNVVYSYEPLLPMFIYVQKDTLQNKMHCLHKIFFRPNIHLAIKTGECSEDSLQWIVDLLRDKTVHTPKMIIFTRY